MWEAGLFIGSGGRGSPEEEGGVLADGALLPPAGGERGGTATLVENSDYI